MNRNKAIVSCSIIEAVIIIALIGAWVSHAISLTVFIAGLIAVGTLSMTYIVSVIKRYPPENRQ